MILSEVPHLDIHSTSKDTPSAAKPFTQAFDHMTLYPFAFGTFTDNELRNLQVMKQQIDSGGKPTRSFDPELDSKPSQDGFFLIQQITHGDMTDLSRNLFVLAQQSHHESIPHTTVPKVIFELSTSDITTDQKKNNFEYPVFDRLHHFLSNIRKKRNSPI